MSWAGFDDAVHWFRYGICGNETEGVGPSVHVDEEVEAVAANGAGISWAR